MCHMHSYLEQSLIEDPRGMFRPEDRARLGLLPLALSDGSAQQVCLSGHESRWHVHQSLT